MSKKKRWCPLVSDFLYISPSKAGLEGRAAESQIGMGKNGAPEAPENAAQCICAAGIEPPKIGGSRCKQLRPMGSFRVGRRNYGHRQLWPMTIERKRNFPLPFSW